MADDLVLEVPMSPDAARGRLAGAINRPPRRVLGVLKVSNEYVGVVRGNEFEVWERRRHAIHAVGRIERRGKGSRVSARFLLTGRSRILIAAFFPLYAIVGIGLLSRGEQPLDPLVGAAVMVLGAGTIAAVFAINARDECVDLERFISGVFAEAGERPAAPVPSGPHGVS